MARRRRRSFIKFPRSHWSLRLVLLAVLGLAGYWGKGTWNDPSQSAPGQADYNDFDADSSPTATSPRPINSVQGESVLVERVVDGDTLVIMGGDRIRLIGVDTPETHHPTKPAQPFGREAFEFTRRLAEGKRVVLRFDPGESKDRYGRTLAYVYVDGQFLNEVLLREGLARALTNYPFSPDMKARFRAAEAQAKAAKRGVWSLPRSPFDVSSKPRRDY